VAAWCKEGAIWGWRVLDWGGAGAGGTVLE
jgi:hypothetical protein